MKTMINNTHYSISRDGVLINEKTNRERKFSLANSGYMQTQISINGKIKNILQHRVLAEAFIPNPKNKQNVNHINGIKNDNRLENLEWCSKSENILHSYKTLNRQVRQIDKKVIDDMTKIIYKNITHASKVLKVSRPYLSNMLRGIQPNKTTMKFYAEQ